MDPMTAALISGGGTIIQGLFGQSSAQASMDFQKEVLQNRNQWAVEDLKKAGLNPILAAGATNSSAAGAQAHIDNPGEKAVTSAMSAKMADIAKDKLISEMRVNESLINKNNQEAAYTAAKVNEIQPGIDKTVADTELSGVTAAEKRQGIQESIARVEQIYGNISKLEAEVDRLVADREHILAQIKVATSQAIKNTLEANLAAANTRLTAKLEEGREIANEGLKITNTLNSYELARGKEKNDFYNSTFGKWVFRAGETIKQLSPFVQSGIGISKTVK